jgi:hypothetical protein
MDTIKHLFAESYGLCGIRMKENIFVPKPKKFKKKSQKSRK